MDIYIWFLPVLTTTIFIVSLFMKKMTIFLNFATRLCVGSLALFFTSEILKKLSVGQGIGLNTLTISTVGILGVAGYVLIVFISVYQSFK